MKLEELIYKRMSEWQAITNLLTEYSDTPAIFYQTAPGDVQKGWNGSQYPRIVFDLNTQANTERRTAGTLIISILCESSGTDPEEISPHVINCLKDIVMNPNDSFPYCFAWLRSDAFELENRIGNTGSSRTIIGQEIRFDLLEYSEQITTDPDPVVTINEFIKAEFPDVFVLGLDEVQNITVADEEHPIIYVRVENSAVDYQSFAVTWMTCRMAIHIIAPGPKARGLWVKRISTLIALRGEAVQSDGSPLLIQASSVNNSFDYLVTGQITINTRYGMVRLTAGEEPLLRNIKIRR